MEESVKVHVSGFAQVNTPFGPAPVLLLEDDRERVLPVVIGGAEASSIALALSGVHPPVPNTHDFMMKLLNEVNIRVKKGEIYDLEANRFLAKITVESGVGEVTVSGRPSDIIALAVRAGADIYVAEKVMKAASAEKAALMREIGEGSEEEGEES